MPSRAARWLHRIAHRWHEINPFITNWLRHEWMAVVFVASAVAVVHHTKIADRHLLDLIDGYAFVLIGNLIGESGGHDLTYAGAIVVEIDQARFDDMYSARTPLDRCQLVCDLRSLYKARPALLVVDLDLSPALWLMKTSEADEGGQRQCQQDLYALIKANKDTVKTVLLSPFELADIDGTNKPYWETKTSWQSDMEQTGDVRFGHGLIPVEFGLALRSYMGPGSLVGAAHDVLEERRRPDTERPAEEPTRIHPREYLRRGGVQVVSLNTLEDARQEDRWRYLTGRIVFFGAAYGSEEDTFITPTAEVYGVELHAAALLSLRNPLSKGGWLSFVVDLLFAAAFGLVTACFWGKYLRARRSRNHSRAGLAGIWVIGLGFAVAVILVGLLFVSFYLLRSLAIWSSPVPVMIGMLIDSIVARWLEDSEYEARTTVTRWKARLVTFVFGGSGRRWSLSRFVAVRRGDAEYLAQEGGQATASWETRLATFVFGNSQGLWGRNLTNMSAALWITGRRIVWLGVVGYALFSVSHD